MNKSQKIWAISFLFIFATLFIPVFAGISSSKSDFDVMGNDKSLYGKTTNGAAKQIIGIDNSGVIQIDEDGLGVNMLDVTMQDVTIDDFFTMDRGVSVNTSATTNATITPNASYQLIDTWLAGSVSTCNFVATANISTGSVLILTTAADGRDVVFIETGNLNLGGTRTLDNTNDKLMLIKDGDDSWSELSFSDNE